MTKITLTECLKHMKELIDAGMEHHTAFDDANNEYIHRLIEEEVPQLELQEALAFLSKTDYMGQMNISNMIEQLEDEISSVTAK